MWGEWTWFIWSDFILTWSEVSYGEVLGDKTTVHFRVTLKWGYFIELLLFYLVCILWCDFNWFCNMSVRVCLGFVMCGFSNVWVVWRCGFYNMCVCLCEFLLCGSVCVGFVILDRVYVERITLTESYTSVHQTSLNWGLLQFLNNIYIVQKNRIPNE